MTDTLLSSADNALRTLFSPPATARRDNPAADKPSVPLSAGEARRVAGLMRVNHSGEIAAQALYQGHAAVARDAGLAQELRHAAAEEADHLSWCAERLRELEAGPSRLAPLWYGGAFAIGVISGLAGDRWSLGFIAETERQVVDHLHGHLGRLPAQDERSRAILEQMAEEEAVHGDEAIRAGATPLPAVVRRLMTLTARIMTRASYWI